jgi:hypothetical protein
VCVCVYVCGSDMSTLLPTSCHIKQTCIIGVLKTCIQKVMNLVLGRATSSPN